MKTHRILAAITAFILALGFILIAAVPANAANVLDGLNVDDITHLDFTTPTNAGAWKTTVPASVLRDAAKAASTRPSSVPGASSTAARIRASAALASQMRQTKAAFALSSTMLEGESVVQWRARISAAGSGADSRIPAAIASVKSKWRIPATGLGVLGKVATGANVVGLALLSVETGFQVGKGVSSSWGLDVDGGICAPTFADAGLVAVVTGTDCTEFLRLQGDYVINQDSISGLSSDWICSGDASPRCQRFLFTTRDSSPDINQEYVCGESKLPFGSTARRLLFVANGVTQSTTVSSQTIKCGSGKAPNGSAWLVIYLSSGADSSGVSGACWAVAAGSPCVEPETPIIRSSGDPDRRFECIITGTDGNQYTAYSDDFTEGSGVVAEPKCPALPDEVDAENIRVNESGPEGPAEVYNEDTTDAYRALGAAYPECMTGLCFADLRKVQGTTTKSCFDDLDESACLDWFNDPAKADTYQCWYAGKISVLEECNHYGSTFDSSKRASGQAYSDPDTGTAVPAGSVNPTPDSFSNPVLNPAEPRNCFPTGWGAINPLAWVFQPVTCAFQWAFVPRASVVQSTLDRAFSQFDTKMPGQLTKLIAGLEFIPPASGCGGITVDVFFLGPPFQIMQACPGDALRPMADLSRLFGNLGFTVYGVIALTRHVARVFGFGGLGKDSGE